MQHGENNNGHAKVSLGHTGEVCFIHLIGKDSRVRCLYCVSVFKPSWMLTTHLYTYSWVYRLSKAAAAASYTVWLLDCGLLRFMFNTFSVVALFKFILFSMLEVSTNLR